MQKTFRYPVACTIAGSDSGGGAGIQADIKTFSALGVYGASVVTAITAQNTLGVIGIQAISPEILRKQLTAVFEDIKPDAVKIGMLHNADAVYAVAECIDTYKPRHVVLDPVMVAESGSNLMEGGTAALIMSELFHRVTIVTPNISEAETLAGMEIKDYAGMADAAQRLIDKGAPSVLLKGGHIEGEEKKDYLIIKGMEPVCLSLPTVYTDNAHGTGCTLSSAIAAYLALGEPLPDAVWKAKQYLTKALQAGAEVAVGMGKGPVNHFFDPKPLNLEP